MSDNLEETAFVNTNSIVEYLSMMSKYAWHEINMLFQISNLIILLLEYRCACTAVFAAGAEHWKGCDLPVLIWDMLFFEWGLLYGSNVSRKSSLQLLYLLHLDCLDCSWYVVALFARPSKMCRVAGTHILSGGTGALGIANASDTFGALSYHGYGYDGYPSSQWVLPGHCTIPGWRGSQIHLPSFKGWPSSNRGKEWFWEFLTYHCFFEFPIPGLHLACYIWHFKPLLMEVQGRWEWLQALGCFQLGC